MYLSHEFGTVEILQLSSISWQLLLLNFFAGQDFYISHNVLNACKACFCVCLLRTVPTN